MKYNPKNKTLSVETKNLDNVYFYARHAIKQIRIAENLPLTPYDREGSLLSHDHAMISIIDMCECVGIDMGLESSHDFNKLDLSDL